MRIRHETADASLGWNVQAPLVFEMPSGELVRIKSWSLAGLVWPQDAPDCPKTGTLSVPFQGVDVRFPVRLTVCAEEGLVKLEGLSGRQRETMALFYRSLLSGKMASSGEVITSLDTPVDLVPMEQTEAEQAEQPVKLIPRPIRMLFNIATYLLIATMVVGIIGANIFTSLNRIDIQHGRVLAPMQQSFPSRQGLVHNIDVTAGQRVEAGDVLVQLRDPEIYALVIQTEAELTVAERERARIDKALQELETHKGSDDTALRMAITARIYAAFVDKGGFEDMRRQWLAMRGHQGALAEISDPLPILIDLLTAQVGAAASHAQGLRAKRTALLELIERSHIRAPSDGVVHQVRLQPGQVYAPQADDLIFERAEPRVTVGWVSEKFAETLFIGMPATIGLNEDGKKTTLEGFVTDVRAGDHPERPGEFGIMVTVSATELDAEATKTRLRVGAPVNLEADRQWGQRIKTWLVDTGVWHG